MSLRGRLTTSKIIQDFLLFVNDVFVPISKASIVVEMDLSPDYVSTQCIIVILVTTSVGLL